METKTPPEQSPPSCLCCHKQSNKHIALVDKIVLCSYACLTSALTRRLCHEALKQSYCGGYRLINAFSSPISSVLAEFPDKYLATGKLDLTKNPIKLFLGNASEPAEFPKALPRLKELSRQAPFGKGDETITDTNVRRVLETDHCMIEWNMQPLLLEIAQQLSLPATLSGSFYKLLYYQKKDFFLEHYDSKKSPNHLLTLAVDLGSECVGGTLEFPSASGRAEKWESNGGAGSWACWFTTQRHAVTKLRSGYRVIAVYNIEVASMANNDLFVVRNPMSTVAESRSPFLRLPADVLRLILNQLATDDNLMTSIRSVLQLSRTCKPLRSMLQNPAWVMGTWLASQTSMLKQVMRAKYEISRGGWACDKHRVRQLGVVLRHRYSFDGAKTLPLSSLRGRDRTVAQALLHSRLGPVSVVPCFLRGEKVEDRYGGNASLSYCEVFRAVTNPSRVSDDDSDYDYEAKSAFLQSCSDYEKTLLPAAAAEKNFDWDALQCCLRRTQTECDVFNLPRFWPFWDVLWMVDHKYLMNLYTDDGHSASRENLYGNSSTFHLYWYESAAILLDLSAHFKNEEEEEDDVPPRKGYSMLTASA